MDEPLLVKNSEGVKELGGEHLDELGAEPAERVLLDKLVKI